MKMHIKQLLCGTWIKKRGGREWTKEEIESSMLGKAPGSPNLAILSFNGSFHGRLLGCLTTTHSKPLHKLDFPAFDWPMAPFPRLSYPLENNIEKNRKEEERCLSEVERLIIESRKTGKSEVAALVVEPIQAEGGDNHASPKFFQGLRDITKKHGVAFIVDEVQTGVCATGTFWAHQQWNLSSPPDLVTFSKKTQLAGYFYRNEFRPKQSYRIFNTWMGDPFRLLQLEVVVNTIKKDKLLENTKISGEFTLNGLKELEKLHYPLISNVRGVGTFIAVDAPDAKTRDTLIQKIRLRGVELGSCGERSIRLRPALIFKPKHAAIFLDAFDAAVHDFKK